MGLSRTGQLALTGLLLTGYAVGSLLAAGLAMAMYLSGAQLRQIFAYLLGSFGGSPGGPGTPAAHRVRRHCDRFPAQPERAAARRGPRRTCVDVTRERRILLPLATLVTAAAVTISGLIGLPGWWRHPSDWPSGRRAVLPLSALLAILLAGADLCARLGEIPVGRDRTLLGAPFFLAMLR